MACSLDSVTAGGQGSRPAARSAAAATYDMYTAQQTETIAHVKGLLWCGGRGVWHCSFVSALRIVVETSGGVVVLL